jgi:hypothetical protein
VSFPPDQENSGPAQNAPVPLEYRAPQDEPRPPHVIAHAIVGSILTAIVLVVAVFATILACYATQSGAIGIVVCAVGVAALIWLSLVLFRNPRSRGWALGLWIGVGLAMLIEGACFFGFR